MGGCVLCSRFQLLFLSSVALPFPFSVFTLFSSVFFSRLNSIWTYQDTAAFSFRRCLRNYIWAVFISFVVVSGLWTGWLLPSLPRLKMTLVFSCIQWKN